MISEIIMAESFLNEMQISIFDIIQIIFYRKEKGGKRNLRHSICNNFIG